MKILIVSSAGYEQGGAENGIVLRNKILSDAGHVVKVISSDVEPSKPHFSDYEFKSVPDRGLGKLVNAVFNIDAYRVMKTVLKEFNPDVVMLHTMSQPTASVLFALKKHKTIMYVHGPEVYTKSLLPWYLSSKDYRHESFKLGDLTLLGTMHYIYFRFVCRPLYLLGFKYVDEFVSLSTYTQKMLEKEGIRSAFLPNGARLFEPVPIKKTNTILYAGRLEKFKGVDDLLHAMPQILKTVPDATLLIAGEGNYMPKLTDIAVRLKITESVEFLGFQDSKSLAKKYEDCTVFAMPSTWPETFGKVGVEAMSIGRPVVASDVGGVRDWLDDEKVGFLVRPHNPKDIAEKILKVLNYDERKLQMISHQCVQQASKFSIDAMTTRILELSKTVIDSSNNQWESELAEGTL